MTKIDISKIPFYVINLDRSKNRWNRVSKSFEREKMKSQLRRFPAVDGSKLDIEKMRKDGEVKIPVRDRANKPGAIANYLSIMNVFKRAVKNNYEYIVLMEDDQVLTKDFKKKFQKSIDDLESLDKPWDIMYLGSDESQNRAKIIKRGLKVRRPFQDRKSKNIYGNNGYLIKKSAMKKILKHAFPMVEASDIFIIGMGKNPFHKNPQYPKINEYYTAYPYIIETFNTSSTIG